MEKKTDKEMDREYHERERKAHYDAKGQSDKLIINFRDINHVMRSLYEGRGSQKGILIMLLETAPITQKKLTDKLGIQPGTASEVLAKLEKGGLIVRSESQDDRRTVDITLTEQGRALAEETAKQRGTRHEEMFSCLTGDEKGTLIALLEKINADWKNRYRNIEDHACGSHGHNHGHFHGHEKGKGGGCDGNCRECTHPCGRGKGRQDSHEGDENHGGRHHHGSEGR